MKIYVNKAGLRERRMEKNHCIRPFGKSVAKKIIEGAFVHLTQIEYDSFKY